MTVIISVRKRKGVYNPFSLFNALTFGLLRNFWFNTGTPTYLIKLLKSKHFELSKFNAQIPVAADKLSKISDNMSLMPILYQSGYLTIVGYDSDTDTCMLGFPNKEVEDGFFENLLPYYANLEEEDEGDDWTYQFSVDVRSGKVDSFMTALKSFLADIPEEREKYIEMTYRNILYVIFKMRKFDVQLERKTSGGIIDMVVKTPEYIYVMEFKVRGNGTAQDAINQIEDKHYADPYKSDGRKVVTIGVGFDDRVKNISNWIYKELDDKS